MSKKSLFTAVSTAALVATIGFAYAQSAEEGAVPNANINGSIDNNVPKHWARDSVINDPYETAAPTAAGPSTSSMPPETTMPADTSTSSTVTPPAADATSPWAADTTSTPPAANTTDSINQSNSSLSTNTAPPAAPSETHVDLNSPNDPIYNLGTGSATESERAPRPDRN